MSSIQALQAQMWYPAAQLKWKKRGEGKIQPLAICQHTKSPIFTLEIEISVINVFIWTFLYINRNEFLGWIFMRCSIYSGSNNFCHLWHNLGTDGLQSDCCQQSISSPAILFSYLWLYFNLTHNMLSSAHDFDCPWDTISAASVLNPSYLVKMCASLHAVC